MSKRCGFCARDASILCDYPIGRTDIATICTCDTPICERCAKRIGYMRVRGKKGIYGTTIDHCPDHGEAPSPCNIRIMRQDEINQWREDRAMTLPFNTEGYLR